MIENARIIKFVQTLKGYEAAVITFKDTYNELPGDMRSPATRIPNCTTAPCNIPSNGNGKIGESGEEIINFWNHLIKTNMINGATLDTDSGSNTYGTLVNILGSGNLFISMNGPTELGEPDGNYLVMGWMSAWPYGGGLSGKRASRIDRKMDDGIPLKGDFMGEPDFVSMVGDGYECFIPATQDYKEDSTDNNACTTFYKLPF